MIINDDDEYTRVDVVTENDGSYTFTEDDLSPLGGMEDWYVLEMIYENRSPISAPGYDPRSVLRAMVGNRTTLNFLE